MNAIFSKELGINLQKFPQEQLSEMNLGQQIAELIQAKIPLLICFETVTGTQAGHWVVLCGLERKNVNNTAWKLMDSSQGKFREISTADLARYVIGNPGFVPQLFTAKREATAMFKPKINAVFTPKNTK